jgi:hypothetical protein
VTFAALLDRMLAKQKIAIATLSARTGIAPRLVALVWNLILIFGSFDFDLIGYKIGTPSRET